MALLRRECALRTEWFIWGAAVVLLVLGSIAVVDLRSGDDPTAVESPSPSPSPTAAPTTPAPTVSETDERSPEPTPSPSPSPSVSPSVEPSPTASPTATPSPEPTGANGGGNASPISYSTASFTASNSRFSDAGAASRTANFEQSCPVVAEQGETFTACRAAFSSSRSRWWAVTEVAQGGGHVATLWQHNGAGAFNRVAMTGAYSVDMTMGGPTWPNHDDVMTLDFGSSLEVLSYETSAGPIVTGVVPLSSSASFDVLAQRVFVRTSGANRTTTVLDLNPGGGLEGRRAQLSAASDRSPEEVALVVYRAWINNNRAAAAPWVNDRVDEALFEDTPNQGGDLFELTGTSCPLANGAFTCTFTYPFGTMEWEIRPVNGVLRVVDIESSG